MGCPRLTFKKNCRMSRLKSEVNDDFFDALEHAECKGTDTVRKRKAPASPTRYQLSCLDGLFSFQ